MSAPLWIGEKEAEALADPLALVAAVEAGFARLDAEGFREPASTRMDGLDGGDAYLTLFPAHDPEGWASAKVLAGRPANAAEGRPEIDAVVALVEAEQGRIAALVAARALTALRTAAATAVALKHLAPQRPLTIALIGTGAQARAHARVLAAVLPVARFVVAAPRRGLARAQAFATELGLPAEARSLAAAAEGCDVVVTLSLAARPLPLGPLGADAVLASVGPFYPDAHEIDPALLGRAAQIVSDHPERLRRQWAGSALLALDRLPLTGIADLVAGRAAPARQGLRVLLSDGRGFQDNVAVRLVFEAALRQGRGLPLP